MCVVNCDEISPGDVRTQDSIRKFSQTSQIWKSRALGESSEIWEMKWGTNATNGQVPTNQMSHALDTMRPLLRN
jgi:hypothetical protein